MTVKAWHFLADFDVEEIESVSAKRLVDNSAAEVPAALGEYNGYCVTHDVDTRSASPSKFRQLRKAKELVPEFDRFQLCHDAAQKRAHGVGIYVKGKAAWLGGVIRCGRCGSVRSAPGASPSCASETCKKPSTTPCVSASA